MPLFFKKVTALILPLFAVLAFPLFVEIRSGEFLALNKVIEKQLSSKEVLYGPAYSDQSIYFKIKMIQKINPTVLAIGNSKLLTLRSQFFNDGVTFYNAGGTAGDIASFRKILEVTKVTPSYIIMVVEPLHFDPALIVSDATFNKKNHSVSYVEKVGSIISQSWIGVYQDYFSEKFTLRELVHVDKSTETVGLNAWINKSGIRNDGSYHYGKQYESLELKQQKLDSAIKFLETKSVLQGKEFFSTQALEELNAFLLLCKQRGIYVVGIIPPTPKVIEETYRKYPKYEYMSYTYEKTLPIFQKYNFKLYNFYSLSSLDATDEETIDEYHTSEKVMLRAMIKMSDGGQPLSKVATKTRLQKILSFSKDQNDVMK